MVFEVLDRFDGLVQRVDFYLLLFWVLVGFVEFHRLTESHRIIRSRLRPRMNPVLLQILLDIRQRQRILPKDRAVIISLVRRSPVLGFLIWMLAKRAASVIFRNSSVWWDGNLRHKLEGLLLWLVERWREDFSFGGGGGQRCRWNRHFWLHVYIVVLFYWISGGRIRQWFRTGLFSGSICIV